MLKFTKILELIQECDKTITAEKLIRALPLVGILLRGNWIAQSEILFPAETLSNSNGVSADLMIRARDYIVSILLLISKEILKICFSRSINFQDNNIFIGSKSLMLHNCLQMKFWTF